MARLVTREQLCTRVLQRADVENDPHVAGDELIDLVNEAIPRVWDILVSCAPPDYYSATASFSTVAGQLAYALADVAPDFYKMRGLWRMESGAPVSLRDVNASERGAYGPPLGATALTMRYIPCAPKLEADEDTIDGVNGWEELIVLEAAIDILNKQERDPRILMNKRDREEQRIRAMAYRDAGSPARIQRVRGRRYGFYESFGEHVTGYALVGQTIEVCRASVYP